MNVTAGYTVAGYVEVGQSYLLLQIWDAAAGMTPMTAAEWSSTGGAIFEATYYV